MTEPLNDLESELASLCPRGLSHQSRRRIELALSPAPQLSHRAFPRRILLYTALAASLLIAFFVCRALVPTPKIPTAVHEPSSPPFGTLASYRQALARGTWPGRLDELIYH